LRRAERGTKPQHDEDHTSSSLGFTIEESVVLTDALYCIVKEEVKGNHKTRISLVLTTVRRSDLKGREGKRVQLV
jgi:hypothetical protein